MCFDLGLDEPFYRQFGIWLSQLLEGDLGTSIFSGLPVTQLIAQRFEPTLALTILTMINAIGMAIPLGTVTAWNAGTWIDRGVMIFVVLGFSLPVFWQGFPDLCLCHAALHPPRPGLRAVEPGTAAVSQALDLARAYPGSGLYRADCPDDESQYG